QGGGGEGEEGGDVGQGVGGGGEEGQVVEALGLVVDLVGQLAPAPDVVAIPVTAAALDVLAEARDDLVLPILGHIRVEQQQNFVLGHSSRSAPFGLVGSTGSVAARVHGGWRSRKWGHSSIGF